MVRNKVTALILASTLALGTVVSVYADYEDGAVSSSSVQDENVNTGSDIDTTDDSEITPAPDPTPDDSVVDDTTTDDSSDNSGSGTDSAGEIIPDNGTPDAEPTPVVPTTDTDTADSDAVNDAANQASNETQAAQQTIGVPGTAAPDLSWVSPLGIKAASYLIGELSEKEETLSSAVRKDYTKIDPSYAIAKADETKIFEERNPESRTVGTIAKGGVLNVLKERGRYLYVESNNVRGYMLKSDVLYGSRADIYAAKNNLSEAPKAVTVVKLEENAAADDYPITAYYFEKEVTGEDLVKYAVRHKDTQYKEEGDDWDTGLDNIGFIKSVYGFYRLSSAAFDKDDVKEYSSYGKEVTELTDAQAGDFFILDTEEVCIYTGNDSVLICSEEEQGIVEKDIKDVLVTCMRRPDYESLKKTAETEKEEIPDNTLIGDTVEEQCWNYLINNIGLSEVAAAGAMGNIKAECGFKPGNLENWVNALMNCSDEQFTAAVDTGVYTYAQFMDDKYTYPTTGNGSQWGYGLIGFTSRSAKAVLWANTVSMGRSLSDLRGQLDAVAQIYGVKLFWMNNSSVDQAAADWFYYVGMGNPLGGTNGYGYEYTIPTRQAYAQEYYAMFHS